MENSKDGGGGDNCSCKMRNASVKSSPTYRYLALYRMSSVKTLAGNRKISHSTDVGVPKLTWGLPTLSGTTKGSWLPWGGLSRNKNYKSSLLLFFSSVSRIKLILSSNRLSISLYLCVWMFAGVPCRSGVFPRSGWPREVRVKGKRSRRGHQLEGCQRRAGKTIVNCHARGRSRYFSGHC